MSTRLWIDGAGRIVCETYECAGTDLVGLILKNEGQLNELVDDLGIMWGLLGPHVTAELGNLLSHSAQPLTCTCGEVTWDASRGELVRKERVE
jgi:hypothetical protein